MIRGGQSGVAVCNITRAFDLLRTYLDTLRAAAVVMGFSVSIVMASECALRVGMRTDVQLGRRDVRQGPTREAEQVQQINGRLLEEKHASQDVEYYIHKDACWISSLAQTTSGEVSIRHTGLTGRGVKHCSRQVKFLYIASTDLTAMSGTSRIFLVSQVTFISSLVYKLS